MKNILPLLLLCFAAVWVQPASAQRKKNAPAPAPKIPLTHDVYDGWRSVTNVQTAPDGRVSVFLLSPQEGDATLVLRQLASNRTDSVQRAATPQLSWEGNYVAFRLKPASDTLKALRRKKTKDDQLPKDTLAIWKTTGGPLVKIPRVQSFKMPEKAEGWVAALLEKQLPAKKAEKDTTQKEARPEAKTKEKAEGKDTGTRLIVHHLMTSAQDTFPFVTEYEFAKNGRTLLFASTGDERAFLPGVYAFELASRGLRPLYRAKGAYKQLSWDENGEQAAFLADLDTGKARIRYFSLYHWKRSGTDSAQRVADTSRAEIPRQWLVSEHARPYFAKDGSRLFFGVAPVPVLEDTTLLPEEMVKVDVWNWLDGDLQPMQLRRLEQDKKRSYLSALQLSSLQMVRLGSPEIPTVVTGAEGNAPYALGLSDLAYRRYVSWEGASRYDAWLIDLQTGQKQQIFKEAPEPMQFSPAARYLYWYSRTDSAWFAWSVQERTARNLTKDLPVSFADELNDVPDQPYSYGAAGWTENDEWLLVYDRFDIWALDPTGQKAPVRITGNGRAASQRYRYEKTDPELTYIDPRTPLLLSTFNERTRAEGFSLLNLSAGMGSQEPQRRLLTDHSYTFVAKARQADRLLFLRETYQDSPDLYTSDLSFRSISRLSLANPQQSRYLWGTAELYTWTSASGQKLEGLLFKPEGFDPRRQYPMVTYFYELMSDRLNKYVPPTPSPSTIRASMYTSNGYLVFMPDIPYTLGFPGQSAEDAIVSGVISLIDKGFVDKERIGIQGQSWGGYQVAHLITRTNLFRAAMAGAPVVNMTSAYGGIRWGTGMSRMFQYERTQSRIGGTLWDKPLHYIENSPLFHLDRVQTPLLMMHNDQDGAVPWYQGIECFVGLRRLGKPVWMLNYNGEDHNLRERKNRKDLSVRMTQFFDHYLKDAPMPHWMQYGVPAVEKGLYMRYELPSEPASGTQGR